MAELRPLRRRMIEDMTVRNMAPATRRFYISAVSKLSRYFGKSPERLDLEDVRAFQVHLVATGISWQGLNHCALRFFHGVTPGKGRCSGAHPLRAGATQATRHIGRRRSRAVSLNPCRAGRAGRRRPPLMRPASGSGISTALGASFKSATAASTSSGGGKDRNVMPSPQLLGIPRAIGSSPGRRPISFPDAMKSIRSIRRCCTPPAGRRSKPRV